MTDEWIFQCLDVLGDKKSSVKLHLHSRNEAAKLTHVFPSQLWDPCLFTVPGMLWVSKSCSRSSCPDFDRNPTMIFGTPSRKDCIQNLHNLRSNLSWSESDWISSEVFNSTQLIGCSLSSGLRSQTIQCETSRTTLIGEWKKKFTGIGEKKLAEKRNGRTIVAASDAERHVFPPVNTWKVTLPRCRRDIEGWCQKKWTNLPASTSPPMIKLELPIPVSTTEQYCWMLSTTTVSLDSM